MWDAGIWKMRFTSYSMTSLVDVIERNGVDAPLSLLADEEIARRVQRATGQDTSTPCAASDRHTRPHAADTRSPHTSTDAE